MREHADSAFDPGKPHATHGGSDLISTDKFGHELSDDVLVACRSENVSGTPWRALVPAASDSSQRSFGPDFNAPGVETSLDAAGQGPAPQEPAL